MGWTLLHYLAGHPTWSIASHSSFQMIRGHGETSWGSVKGQEVERTDFEPKLFRFVEEDAEFLPFTKYVGGGGRERRGGGSRKKEEAEGRKQGDGEGERSLERTRETRELQD
jgi:hypothetical protein